MSHWADITTQITEVESLRKAVVELGGEVLVDATARGYHNNRIKADLVIRFPGCPYDIAGHKQPDGTYKLTTDWFEGHVVKIVGSPEEIAANAAAAEKYIHNVGGYGNLLQLYEKHVAIDECLAQGYSADCQVAENGDIVVTAYCQ